MVRPWCFQSIISTTLIINNTCTSVIQLTVLSHCHWICGESPYHETPHVLIQFQLFLGLNKLTIILYLKYILYILNIHPETREETNNRVFSRARRAKFPLFRHKTKWSNGRITDQGGNVDILCSSFANPRH